MVRRQRERNDFPSFDSSRLDGRRRPLPAGDQLSDMSNELFVGRKQRLTPGDNVFDRYAKHPVNNIEFDGNFGRRKDSDFHPKFSKQFYNDEQQNVDRRAKWKFANSQRNYFDQYIIQPTRYDPLFRRNNNLNLNPNDHHRSTQFGYYNQQIDDPRRWGRKKPPKHKYRHWDEYFQRNMYGRDNNFQSVTGLDEMRLMHEKHFKDKNNDMNRYINEQPYINYKKNGKVQREDYWQLYH